MKDWPTDHPKAKLMARKRAAILDAAREAFLRDGYEGTSMEEIAAERGRLDHDALPPCRGER